MPQPPKNKKPKKHSLFNWAEVTPAPIIGVDEVGRGCLAGPVYAAAVIINSDFPFKHFNDSKLLSADKRTILAQEIHSNHKVGIGFASVEEIDRLNIFQATFLAMRRALGELGAIEGHVLVDGQFAIPNLKGFAQTPLIKGDLRATPIAAASIVAKVARDSLMVDLACRYGVYGFEKHKGYATEEHRSAIVRHGPCDIHRKTFGGVKEYLPL